MTSKRPKIQGQNHSDLFLTDPAALQPLMRYIDPKWRIWECACGDDKNPLLDCMGYDYGRSVVGTDIRGYGGKDFLTTEPEGGWDCIVTNPPYSIKDAWIERCYALGKPFALLLPLTALEGRKRQALFKQHGIDLLILPKRVDFTTPNGTVGGSWFPVAWFTWKLLPERLVFA
jgi:hypothetical protein